MRVSVHRAAPTPPPPPVIQTVTLSLSHIEAQHLLDYMGIVIKHNPERELARRVKQALTREGIR